MSEDFAEKHRNITFSNAVSFELQQRPGILYPLCGSVANYSGSTKARIDNRFGHLQMSADPTRNGDTNLTNIDSVVRFIKPRPTGDVAVPIDKRDMRMTEVPLGNPIAKEVAAAARRWHDDEFLYGYYGNAYQGEAGDTTVSFGGSHTVVHGSVGLTLNKLISLREMMGLKDNDEDEEQPIHLITPRQESDLLKITEYKSADYNDSKPLVRGEIKPFMGFRFIKFNPDSTGAYQNGSLTKTSTTRSLPVFFPSGLHRGVWEEFFGRMGERPDKKYNFQAYGEAQSAVVRVDENKCFIHECTES